MEILFRGRSELGAWRMAGAPAFAEWLATRPWAGAGGVRWVRVGDLALGDAFADLVRRAVRAVDDGATDVRIAHVGDPSAASDPIVALADAAGCTAALGRHHERVRALARAIDHPPWVFIFGADAGLSPDEHVRMMNALAEDFQKLLAPVAFTAVVLTVGRCEVADDFVYGDPWAPMSSDRVDQDWSWYLRCRVAWEVAGRLDLAASWWPDTVTREADADLEAVLDARASDQWRGMPESVREDLARWVAGEAAVSGAAEGVLREASVLWRPAGLSGTRVVPWAARAALLAGDAVGADTLRHALSCVPLTRELLARCVDLERRARIRHPAASAARAETEAIARRYATPGTRERAHYPSALALPRDPGSFSSLGEYITLTPMGATRRSLLHDLRALRNHLAHGHFASWHSVRELRRLEVALT